MKRKGLVFRKVKEKKRKMKIWNANDVLASDPIKSDVGVASSMALCVDEPPDRWMEYLGAGSPKDNPNSINRHRVDDMYEATDY